MSNYWVRFVRVEKTYTGVEAYVEADSPQQAVALAKSGEYSDIEYGGCLDSDIIEDDFSDVETRLNIEGENYVPLVNNIINIPKEIKEI